MTARSICFLYFWTKPLIGFHMVLNAELSQNSWKGGQNVCVAVGPDSFLFVVNIGKSATLNLVNIFF